MINDIYIESRYPGEAGLLDDGSMPAIEQTTKFFAFAREVESKIKNELTRNDKEK
jgi:hypothetical protein